MTAISKLQRLEQIDLYHAFASVNSMEVIAGLVYESLGRRPRTPSGGHYTYFSRR